MGDTNIENVPAEEGGGEAYQTREEYVEKLKQWLNDARLWHGFCAGYPHYYVNLPNQAQQIPISNAFYQLRPNFQAPRNNLSIVFLPGTYEFVIPPLWKRLVAEILDFIILFVIKMFLTFIVVEGFNFITVENYGFDTFEKYLKNPKIAMQMSVEILSLELLHRFTVCCYEVYFLKGGNCATPGKKYMGLMVVQAENISPVPGRLDELVRVNPCSTLGVQRAVIRAIFKNLFVGLMLPICFTMYIFRYNRTGYDIISKSLVVEYNPNMHPVS